MKQNRTTEQNWPEDGMKRRRERNQICDQMESRMRYEWEMVFRFHLLIQFNYLCGSFGGGNMVIEGKH